MHSLNFEKQWQSRKGMRFSATRKRTDLPVPEQKWDFKKKRKANPDIKCLNRKQSLKPVGFYSKLM